MIVYKKDKASACFGDRVYESIQEAEKEIQLLEKQSLVKIITLKDYIFE